MKFKTTVLSDAKQWVVSSAHLRPTMTPMPPMPPKGLCLFSILELKPKTKRRGPPRRGLPKLQADSAVGTFLREASITVAGVWSNGK